MRGVNWCFLKQAMNLKKYGSKVCHSKEKYTQLTVKLRFAICH